MKHVFGILTVSLAVTSPVLADVLTDNFDDGVLAPWWSIYGNGTYSVTEASGTLNTEASGNSPPGVARVESSFVLLGDFSLTVDFSGFGPGSYEGSRQAHLAITSMELGTHGDVKIHDWKALPGRTYQMFFPLYDFGEYEVTTDTSGSLSLVRTENTISGYYHDGIGWNLLGIGEFWAGPTKVYLGDNTAVPGYPDVSVSFDNFYAEADQIIPETALATGDFDDDSDVDGTDFLMWQRGEVSNPPSADYLVDWQENFGTISTLSATASIPEPSTLLLGALATVGLLMRRKLLR